MVIPKANGCEGFEEESSIRMCTTKELIIRIIIRI